MANCKICDKCGAIVPVDEIRYACLRELGTRKEDDQMDVCQRCAEKMFKKKPVQYSTPEIDGDRDW